VSETITLAEIRRARVIELLNRSPLLDPTRSVAEERRFVQAARAILVSIPGAQPVGTSVNSVEAATRALEQTLAGRGPPVYATVESVPSRLAVKYRRLADSPGSELMVTTDDRIALQPASYLFSAEDPKTGKPKEQPMSCHTNCRVRFTFSATQ
jgi:hypothetical protein